MVYRNTVLPVPQSQTSKTQLDRPKRVLCHLQDQPLRWCLEICGRRLNTFRAPHSSPQHSRRNATNQTLTWSWAAVFLLQCSLKIALGESDLDSDYSLFPKTCLPVVTITYCRVCPQSLAVRRSFQSQQFFFWAIQKGTNMHICSKSKSSDSSSSCHHARKWRTAPISRIGLVFDADTQNTTSGHWWSF